MFGENRMRIKTCQEGLGQSDGNLQLCVALEFARTTCENVVRLDRRDKQTICTPFQIVVVCSSKVTPWSDAIDTKVIPEIIRLIYRHSVIPGARQIYYPLGMYRTYCRHLKIPCCQTNMVPWKRILLAIATQQL